jgi:phosphatidate phosphatase PAH1
VKTSKLNKNDNNKMPLVNSLSNNFGRLKQSYSELNSTSFSGANDVIVVRQPDDSLYSTPFHVRFGKRDILWSRNQTVNIKINDNLLTPQIQMKLTETGEALFVSNKKGMDVKVPDTPSDSQYLNAAKSLGAYFKSKIPPNKNTEITSKVYFEVGESDDDVKKHESIKIRKDLECLKDLEKIKLDEPLEYVETDRVNNKTDNKDEETSTSRTSRYLSPYYLELMNLDYGENTIEYSIEIDIDKDNDNSYSQLSKTIINERLK